MVTQLVAQMSICFLGALIYLWMTSLLGECRSINSTSKILQKVRLACGVPQCTICSRYDHFPAPIFVFQVRSPLVAEVETNERRWRGERQEIWRHLSDCTFLLYLSVNLVISGNLRRHGGSGVPRAGSVLARRLPQRRQPRRELVFLILSSTINLFNSM